MRVHTVKKNDEWKQNTTVYIQSIGKIEGRYYCHDWPALAGILRSQKVPLQIKPYLSCYQDDLVLISTAQKLPKHGCLQTRGQRYTTAIWLHCFFWIREQLVRHWKTVKNASECTDGSFHKPRFGNVESLGSHSKVLRLSELTKRFRFLSWADWF